MMLWFSLSSRTNFCLTLTLLFACREPHLDAASVCCHCMPRLHNAPRDFEDRLNLDFKSPLINLDLTPNDHLYGNYYHQFSRTKQTSVPPWIWELVRSYSHYYTTTYHMHRPTSIAKLDSRISPKSFNTWGASNFGICIYKLQTPCANSGLQSSLSNPCRVRIRHVLILSWCSSRVQTQGNLVYFHRYRCTKRSYPALSAWRVIKRSKQSTIV